MGQKIITALEAQKRNNQRVNVFLDGEFAFSLTLVEAAKLHKGQALSDSDIDALQNDDAVIKAVDQAARFLAYRPRSIQEVRRNLTQKNIPDSVIAAALERLTAMGYLDDAAFARYWVENRNMFKPHGARALRYELRQKGVADGIIDEILHVELDEVEAAYRAGADRARRLSGTTRQQFRNKVGSFLQRRGFTYTTVQDVVERLIHELDSEAYFVAEEEQE